MQDAQKAADFSRQEWSRLARAIKRWGHELGFQQIGITDTDLAAHEAHLQQWLRAGRHGDMEYMSRHGSKRSRPAELVPETVRVISGRMDYLPQDMHAAETVLADRELGYVSRYALGRDYHKLVRRRLQTLAEKIERVVGRYGYRVFADSAPVLEKALAEKAGLGWIGKHTNLIHRQAGSWFFLGEIYTDLPLPVDQPTTQHCGSCRACIDVCPTQAIVAPYQLDARRCISYLTIELHGRIPLEYRESMGNRIYGCDDCQLVCPWNRYARLSGEGEFAPRHRLDASALVELFAWEEDEFSRRTEGSPIRRIGHVRWLRNVAVALGNAPRSDEIAAALRRRTTHPSELVREHVAWALARHDEPNPANSATLTSRPADPPAAADGTTGRDNI